MGRGYIIFGCRHSLEIEEPMPYKKKGCNIKYCLMYIKHSPSKITSIVTVKDIEDFFNYTDAYHRRDFIGKILCNYVLAKYLYSEKDFKVKSERVQFMLPDSDETDWSLKAVLNEFIGWYERERLHLTEE